MTLTLEQMYEMQKVMDAKIIKDKGLEGKDLMPNTVLALQVEVAELANEWRGFKHWSNDREPRTSIRNCLGCSSVANSEELCSICNNENPMLMETADCLHLFLSIANQLNLPAEDLTVWDGMVEGETEVVFTELLYSISMINSHLFLERILEDVSKHQRSYYKTALYIFYGLIEQHLDLEFEEIAEAYQIKNEINHQRQDSVY